MKRQSSPARPQALGARGKPLRPTKQPLRLNDDALALASVNALRGLSVDMIEAAGSGHPGLPLGAAPILYVLWRRHLRAVHDRMPWPNRDRFVLSAGHGCALLYALLHLCGGALTLGDLRNFRRYPGRTPGHPERGRTPGVEISTGPLGQGAGASVGMALAQRLAAQRFNRPGRAIVDHSTYALLSDGDIMEGVCHEAAAVAGVQKLGRLIWLYDSNDVTLSGPLAQCSSEDVAARFAALGWHVQTVPCGDEDLDGIDAALTQARAELDRPSLVIVRTTIGYGAGALAGDHHVHGAPLGAAAAAACKRQLGLPARAFVVRGPVRAHFAAMATASRRRASAWRQLQRKWQQEHSALAAEYEALHAVGPAAGGNDGDGNGPSFAESFLSTRDASQRCLRHLAPMWPALVGGDGDLAPSTRSTVPGAHRHIAYGVREHAMGAISNGMAAHGSVTPLAATFLSFSDYLKPSLRMSALDRLGVVFLFTHDSIAVGQDGPTHQPVEQLASLRAMPNLTVVRPADAHETWAAWQLVRRRLAGGGGPHALILGRQALPVLSPSRNVHRGGYVVAHARTPQGTRASAPDVVLMATGSEVHLALAARRMLARRHRIGARVVSLPSWEVFAEQSPAYQRSVLGQAHGPRVCIEAGSPLGWERFAGAAGKIIAVHGFGIGASPEQAMAHAGLTVEAAVQAARSSLASHRRARRLARPSGAAPSAEAQTFALADPN